MKNVRMVFAMIFTLVSLLLFSTTAKASPTPHVFFVPTASGQGPCFSNLNSLTEFTYNGGSWSLSSVFNPIGVICPNSAHIASFSGGGKMYVAYFQLDSQVHESLFIISTTNTGTTSQVWSVPFAASSISAPTPDTNTNVVGFTDSSGTPRIFYIGQSNGTQVLVEVEGFGSTWQVQPSLPTGATPLSGTAMAGYLFNSTREVFFVGTDGHIHETYLATSNWLTADVTVASGAPLPISGSSLLGYQFNANGPVYFVAGDLHVHQAWWNGSRWNTNDVTAAAGAPIVEARFVVSPLMGYMFNGQPTVNYVASFTEHIDQMWWTGSQEKWDDWTSLGGVAPPADFPSSASPVTGYAFGSQSTVFYVNSSDNELHETFWNGTTTQDIPLGVVSTPASPEPGLASAIF